MHLYISSGSGSGEEEVLFSYICPTLFPDFTTLISLSHLRVFSLCLGWIFCPFFISTRMWVNSWHSVVAENSSPEPSCKVRDEGWGMREERDVTTSNTSSSLVPVFLTWDEKSQPSAQWTRSYLLYYTLQDNRGFIYGSSLVQTSCRRVGWGRDVKWNVIYYLLTLNIAG